MSRVSSTDHTHSTGRTSSAGRKRSANSSQTSRVALVCDWLTTPGGAEKVLLELHRLYPDAPIYTSQYRPKRLDWFQTATVKTSWLNLFPACLRKFLGPLRQLYFSHLDLTRYDLVISVTGAEAKSVKTRKKPRHRPHGSTHTSAYHICYCHVPTQYYWQMYDQYLAHPGFGFLDPLVRFLIKLLIKPLRHADFRAAQRPDQFVTISHYAAEQIEQYYHRSSVVISPPVAVGQFSQTHRRPKLSTEFSTGYYVIACRQVTWKRVDLAIQACKELQKPLLVIGDGAEHRHLVQLAGDSPFIKFIPWLSATELSAYLEFATGYLFPSLEPFGIAAVEALAAGCPVIAYAEGGSRDFISPGKNGLLFSEPTVDSLRAAILDFEQHKFDRQAVRASAEPFRLQNFQAKIRKLVSLTQSSLAEPTS